MNKSQECELISIMQFSDLTKTEIENLIVFIEEVEDEAYRDGYADGGFEMSFNALT
jgi:hypothetical protein